MHAKLHNPTSDAECLTSMLLEDGSSFCFACWVFPLKKPLIDSLHFRPAKHLVESWLLPLDWTTDMMLHGGMSAGRHLQKWRRSGSAPHAAGCM